MFFFQNVHHVDVRYQPFESLILPVARGAFELFLVYGAAHHVSLRVVISFEDFSAYRAREIALVLVLLLEMPPALLLFGIGFVAHGACEQCVDSYLFENAERF